MRQVLVYLFEFKTKNTKEACLMNNYTSIFGQILSFLPRNQFDYLAYQTGAARNIKGFSCWDQFVAMLFCQLGQCHSLREICAGLAASRGKLKHLGLFRAPKRSTLSYANNHRSWEFYQALFEQFLSFCRQQMHPRHKFRFKNKLYSFDASTIQLCLTLFDWAKFRRSKGAIKLHMLLDHAGYLPQFLHVSDGKRHEINVLRNLSFNNGTILAIDKGFVDYDLFANWTCNGVFFVTPLKDNAKYSISENRSIPNRFQSFILDDQIIQLCNPACPYSLRLVTVWRADKNDTIQLLTNNLKLAASTISSIYKDRWQIEIFFRTIKQNLRIKTFIGTSFNAVMTQIWSALIAILILKYLKFKSSINWSLSNLVALLRLNLLTYKSLWDWLNNPYQNLSPPGEGIQLSLL